MNKTIAVVGSGGRLGAALAREWARVGEDVCGLARTDLDLANPDQIRSVLEPLDFGVLVNCAAQTNVDRCESHREEAMQINAHAVRTIGEICAGKGARCIHIGTDYVFEGTKRTPYTEDDEVVPISQYGLSKRAGEIALLETSDRHLVVRVAWVFGPDRPSFIDQMIERARVSESVQAVGDKVAVPTYSLDAAVLLRPLLFDIPAGGVVHLCNDGECTWQAYAQYAIDCAAAAGLPLKARTVGSLKMADLKAFIAKRPVYSAMSTQKLTALTGQRPRGWKDAVRDYVENHVARAR